MWLKYFRLEDFEIEFIDGDELSMTKQSVTGCLVIPEQESSESKFGIGDPTLKKNVWRHFHLNPYLILNVSLFNQTAHLYVYHEIYYGFCFLNCRKSFLNLNLSISVSVKGSMDRSIQISNWIRAQKWSLDSWFSPNRWGRPSDAGGWRGVAGRHLA